MDLEEEDRVQRLVQPPDGSRGLDIESARVLARVLRDAIVDHQKKIIEAAALSRACPFDLHKLVPVPRAILQRGPDHPASLLWLQTDWGTSQPLRHVHRLPDSMTPGKRKMARRRLEFWSADWTPWAALQSIRQNWPTLCFDIRPVYGDG